MAEDVTETFEERQEHENSQEKLNTSDSSLVNEAEVSKTVTAPEPQLAEVAPSVPEPVSGMSEMVSEYKHFILKII